MHTPGPWSIESPCGHIRANVPDPHNGNLVNTHLFMQVTDNGTDYDERIANARLIAAAPEMLAALQLVRDYVVTMKQVGHEYQIAIDAAIERATGATP